MPLMTGVEFARQAALIRPGMPIILTTGYIGQLQDREAQGQVGIRDLLLKPPSIQSLGTLVHAILSGPTGK